MRPRGHRSSRNWARKLRRISKKVWWSLSLSRDQKICQLLEGREYLIFYFGFYISVALYQATRSYKYKLIKSSKQPYEVSTVLFLPGSLVSVFIILPGSLPWRQTDLHVCIPVHLLFLMQYRYQAHIYLQCESCMIAGAGISIRGWERQHWTDCFVLFFWSGTHLNLCRSKTRKSNQKSVSGKNRVRFQDSSCVCDSRLLRYLKQPIQAHLSTSVQFSSVTQSCPTLCNPMNHSTPGFPVHQLPEFTQTHVHRVSDAIQPSHLCCPLLLLPSIPPSPVTCGIRHCSPCQDYSRNSRQGLSVIIKWSS